MSDTKSNVAVYNDFLKSINDVKRKVRTAQNIKRKALKKRSAFLFYYFIIFI